MKPCDLLFTLLFLLAVGTAYGMHIHGCEKPVAIQGE